MNKALKSILILAAVYMTVSVANAEPDNVQSAGSDAKGGIMSNRDKRIAWNSSNLKVMTAAERKYDKNADGMLSPEETREMLKDKYDIIMTRGKAIVDNPIEHQYDFNKDGVIDSEEAKAIAEDIR